MPSGYEVVVAGGTTPVGRDVVAWSMQCQDLGAGAILPTSIDTDGTREGYDLALTKAISDALDLPVIASGGAGTLEHFYEGAVIGGAQVLLAASVFHYRTFRIREVKAYLQSRGLEVRL
jgi:cyclase